MTAASLDGRSQTLDGLRGIAVLAVVIEHAWPTILPGGYAGVDVFFVLSGFLITRMLLGEVMRSGSVDLIAFYARRVRRIIPAATLCVVVVAVVFATILGVGFGPDFRTEALAAALSVSNFLFVGRATDYFAADPSSSPFLHYWSLAVEEQFYLAWPALVLALVAIGRRAALGIARRPGRPAIDPDLVARWLPIAIAAIIGVGSLGLAIRGPVTEAFFLLPHRAWELLVGGLLAWLQLARPWTMPARLDGLRWPLAAAGALALAITFTTSFDVWPGVATTLPVFGTALLVAGGPRMPGARLLSVAWLRFFGRISYALYLWHWPTLAAAALLALPRPEPPPWMTFGAVGLAIGAAVASTLLVEEPIRFARTRWLARGRAIAAAGTALGVASIAIVALTTAPLVGPPAPLPGSPVPGQTAAPEAPLDLRAQVPIAKADRERLIADNCYTRASQTALFHCVYGAASAADGSPVLELPIGLPVVVLFGDSHAMHWFPAVNDWAVKAGFALVPLARSGCGIAAVAAVETDQENAGCATWREAALAHLASIRPDLIVASSSSAVTLSVGGRAVNPRRTPQAWIAPTTRFLAQLSALGTTVFIADVPRPRFEVPDCFAAHWTDAQACAMSVADAQPPDLVAAQAAAATAAEVAFVDPTPWLCPGSTCTWLLDGRIAYVDNHHITASTALALAVELGPRLSAALDDPIPSAAAPAASD